MRKALLWSTVALLFIVSLSATVVYLQQWRFARNNYSPSPLLEMIEEWTSPVGRIAFPMACLTGAGYLVLLERHVGRRWSGGFPVEPLPAVPLAEKAQ